MSEGFMESEAPTVLYLRDRNMTVVKNPYESMGIPNETREGDCFVNGEKTEIKNPNRSPRPNSNTIKGIIGASIKGKAQAPHIIIDARGTGLTFEDAKSGVYRALNVSRGKLKSVTVILESGEPWKAYPRRVE